MAEPAQKLHVSDRPDRTFESLDALMAELANGARTGARAVLQASPEAGQWPALERELDLSVRRHQALDLPTLETASVALLQRAGAALAALADGGARHQAFDRTLAGIDNARSSWLTFAPAPTVARHLHALLVWYSAWHLIAAGLPLADIRRIIAGRAARPPLPAPSPRPSRVASVPAPAPAAGPIHRLTDRVRRAAPVLIRHVRAAIVAATPVILQAGRLLGAGLLRAVDGLVAWSEAQVAARAEAKAQQAQLDAERRAQLLRQAADDRTRAEAARAQAAPMIAMTALDGPALHTPVIGTWLMLVALSWVSLVWGALLSAPFGVGLGIIATGVAGVIVVPLWGTFWGFFGIGAARDDTLHRMGFANLADDHALARTCSAYCAQLQIPVPALGTCQDFNAFAMGVDHRNATVAIGQPLLTALTPDEVAAVLGHELGHVVSGDMRRMMLMRTFQNATVWFGFSDGVKQLARWIICWAAELAILAFSRNREYWADAVGAALAGKDAMIGALRKLDQGPPLSALESTHARFMIRGHLLWTHPATADRIRALETEEYLRRLPRHRDAQPGEASSRR